MKRALFKSVLVLSATFGAFTTASLPCLAWFGCNSGDSCGSTCNSSSSCCVCRCCECVCNFRLVDGCTLCAWHRTWYGPNALATPLRMYYIPRPPECGECDGYKYGLVLGSYPADDSQFGPDGMKHEAKTIGAGATIPPQALVGFSPARFERLGQIRNELDVVSPTGAPARPAAPVR